MRQAFLLGICLALAACGGQTVVLRNPESGIIVRCGTATGDKGQQQCIETYEAQGFQIEK